MIADSDPLGPTACCPRADHCQVCGSGRELEVATYQTPVGMFCATVCWSCVAAGKAPPVRSWAQAVEWICAHCQHVGIDLVQMGALLHAEAEEASG